MAETVHTGDVVTVGTLGNATGLVSGVDRGGVHVRLHHETNGLWDCYATVLEVERTHRP